MNATTITHATIEKLPRQDKFNAKAGHWVVKSQTGEELGVVAKYPRQGFDARLIGSVNSLGSFKDCHAAVVAIVKACNR